MFHKEFVKNTRSDPPLSVILNRVIAEHTRRGENLGPHSTQQNHILPTFCHSERSVESRPAFNPTKSYPPSFCHSERSDRGAHPKG